jgi:hypothetical protein
MAVPYTFATATGSIPLSQLDSNFSTAITIGNTAVVLGDSISTINNASLANVAITSVATAFPNGYLANSNVVIGTTTINLGSTVTSVDGLTLGNVTIASGNVTITNVSVSTANVSTAVNTSGLVVTSNAVITTSTTTNALRITQTGSGNALLVEDSANPDSTPFVIDASGQVIQGYTTTIAGGGGLTAPVQLNATSSAGMNLFRWSTDATGTVVGLNKSRSSTIGTFSAVTNGDTLGTLRFSGDDGTQFIRGAEIKSEVDGAPGTNDMPGRLVFSTTADGASTPTERMRITSTGVGIGVASGAYPLAVSDGVEVMYIKPSASVTNIVAVSTPLAFYAANLEAMRISTGLNLGIGLTPSNVGSLEIRAGTISVAPILLNAGTNLTNPYAGAIEFDGNVFYATANTTSGRGFALTPQYFRRTTDATAFGPAIANFFGTTSGVSLDTSTFYEVEYNMYFTKTTAGTVTFTLTFSNAPINCDANYVGTPVGGVGTVGTSQTAALVKSTAAASALPATGSLTTAVNHQYTVRAIFQANATTGGTLNLQITSSAGTVTPLTGSYYKITRLPAANTGAFV